jgi:hypothetical protein
MAMPAIGTRVQTPHGIGEVVAVDLPDSWEYLRRAVVRIDEPKPEAIETLDWLDHRACYWPREIVAI